MRLRLLPLWIALYARALASNLEIPPARLALTALAILGPSLLAGLLCWPLLARRRRYAPFLVLLSWLGGSLLALAYQLSRIQPDWSPPALALAATLCSATLFALLILLHRPR